MSEQGTPGHGGKVCTNLKWYTRKGYILEWANAGEIEGFRIVSDWEVKMGLRPAPRHVLDPPVHCPACGIELTPDEEPLPAPEGAVRVEETVLSWGVSLRAYTTNGLLFWLHSGENPAQVRAAWRRAFGKERE